ncbi:MAG: hypothetical protein HYT79_10435 [Elusimicrobia bacterium]|nr:hypothetical protein [Elusimicrobiota bacterium]
MDELDKLEKEKDEELLNLAARIEQISKLAEARKTLFQREAEQLKELFNRSVDNLETTLKLSQTKLAAEIENANKNLTALEARLQEIEQEASPAVVEKKLKALEDDIVRQGAGHPSASLESADDSLSGLHRQIEESIRQKSGQIGRLKENLSLKEKELGQLTSRVEAEKSALVAKYKTALDKKERAAREAIRLLQAEFSRRRLRMQEVTKVVEAREVWLEEEKSRRLEALKGLMGEMESRGQALQQKMFEEKTFWEGQIKAAEQEINALSMRLVTGQAEFAAIKTKGEEELKKLEFELNAEYTQRAEAVGAEVKSLRGELDEANTRITQLIGKLRRYEEANKKEVADLEALAAKRHGDTAQEIKRREGRLAVLREEHQKLLEAKTKELDVLRSEYEAKVLTPTLLAKKKGVEEIEARKKEWEKKLFDLEESHRAERLQMDTAIRNCHDQIRAIEEKLSLEARSHQERMKELAAKKDEMLAPRAARLGELEKTIELTAVKFKDEIAALDERKANIHLEADHMRAAFEATTEEHRRELLFAIENLRAQLEAQQSRSVKEKGQWTDALETSRSQVRRLEKDLEAISTAHAQELRSREDEISASRATDEEKIRSLESLLTQMVAKSKEEIKNKETEIVRAEGAGRRLMENLRRKREAEESRLEARRVELLSAINEHAESFAKERSQLTQEADEVQQKLLKVEKVLEEQTQRWQAVFTQLEEKRSREIGPLEARLRELESQRSDFEAASTNSHDLWASRIKEMRDDLSRRQSEWTEAWQTRKKELTDETSRLEARLAALRSQHRSQLDTLGAERARKETDLQEKERSLEELSGTLAAKRQAAETGLKEEQVRYTQAVEKAKAEIEQLQMQIAAVDAAKEKELAALSNELIGFEQTHRRQIETLQERFTRDRQTLESSLKSQTQTGEDEIAQMESHIENLTVQIKDRSMELEVLRSQQEIESAEISRRKRKVVADLRTHRAELAQELKQVRRSYQERVKEKDHEIYLARLKVELRSKRLEEILSAKRQELERMRAGWAGRAEQTLDHLKTKIDELSAARRAREEELKSFDAKSGQLRENLSELRAGAQRPGASTSWEEKEIERMRVRAKQQIEYFRVRMEELLKTRENEKARLLEAAEKVEPISREASMTLTDFILVWEREVRRMATLIKGLEESSFWRQH